MTAAKPLPDPIDQEPARAKALAPCRNCADTGDILATRLCAAHGHQQCGLCGPIDCTCAAGQARTAKRGWRR